MPDFGAACALGEIQRASLTAEKHLFANLGIGFKVAGR